MLRNAILNFNGISRTTLKFIACITMLIDHMCMVLIQTHSGYLVRITVGRIAFPVFAFLLVEGFFHTRSKRRYALSILVLALVSEVFFDLAKYGEVFTLKGQNTCFTLLLGLLMLICISKVPYGIGVGGFLVDFKLISLFAQLAIAAAFAAAAYYLRTDYRYWGIAVMAAFYFARGFGRPFASVLACAILAYNNPGALLALIPLLLYNDTRGIIPPAGKYLFYAFFPVHFAVLVLIRYLI